MGKKKNLSFVLGTLFLDIVVIWIWHLFFNPSQPYETLTEIFMNIVIGLFLTLLVLLMNYMTYDTCIKEDE